MGKVTNTNGKPVNAPNRSRVAFEKFFSQWSVAIPNAVSVDTAIARKLSATAAAKKKAEEKEMAEEEEEEEEK